MIKFYCPTCQTKLGVPDEYAGRRVRCNKCGQASIVPKAAKEIPSISETTKAADAELQLSQESKSPRVNDLPPIDPNAEVLQKISRNRADTTAASATPANNSGRSGFWGGILTRFHARFGFGNFYLAVFSALIFMTGIIVVWLFLSKLTGWGLEFLFIPTALAPGLGFCVFSRSRSQAIGILSLGLGCLGIICARIAYAHFFILPEWRKVVSSVEITPEYNRVYTLMSSIPFRKKFIYNEIAQQNSEMIAVAISSLIMDKQMEPVDGINVYLKVQIPATETSDPNRLDFLFEDTSMAKDWQQVRQRLQQWDSSRRVDAVQKHYYRYLFFQAQCQQKTLLDDYPVAIGRAFFICPNCMFFMLRIVYCVIGLIGAYKTCSQDYFE